MSFFIQCFWLIAKGIFLWMGLGACITAATGIDSDRIGKILRWGVVHFLYPILIFYSVVDGLNPESFGRLYLYPIWALAFLVIGHVSSLLFAPLWGIRDAHPVYHFGNSIQNFGYIVFALAEPLIGKEALAEVFIFVVGTEMVVWSWGVATVGRTRFFSPQTLLNPPLIACVVALIAVYFDVRVSENLFWQIAGFTKTLMVPVALSCVGGLVYHVAVETKLKGIIDREIISSLVLRHSILPLILAGFIYSLTSPGNLRSNLLLEAAMPSALVPLVLAKIYGAPTHKIGVFVSLSNIIALVTLPFWLTVFQFGK